MPTSPYLRNSIYDNNVTTDEFLPDGQLLVAAAGILTLWNAETGTMKAPPLMLASTASNTGAAANQSPPAPIIALDPASRDEIAITGPEQTTVELWRTRGWHRVRIIGPFSSIADTVGFSPDGTSIGVLTRNGTAEVFNSKDGSTITTIPAPSSGSDPSLSLLKSGYVALVDSGDVYLWHGSVQIAHVSAPTATIFNSADISENESQLPIDLIANTANTGLSTPHPFYLAPDPAQWADRICMTVNRTLTSQELSIPGPTTPDNGC